MQVMYEALTRLARLLGALIEFHPLMNSISLRNKVVVILFKHYIIIVL